MALTKNTGTTSAASRFETPDDDNTVDTGTETGTMSADERVAAALAAKGTKPAPAPAEEAAPAATESASRAVAAPAATAVATTIMSKDPLAACEDALRVNYNDLTQIMVTNGNVALKEGKELLGDHVGLEIISFQNQWVCSPGGDTQDDESKEYLKFSDDGVYVKGTDQLLTDAVKLAVAAGYEKAKIAERLILVGALVYPGKDKKGNVIDELQDELVQIDLAPRSKAAFKAYRINAAFKVSKGLLDPQAALRVCMSAKVMSKGTMNWTDAEFKVLTDADMK